MPENSKTKVLTPENPVYLSPTPGKITIAAFYPTKGTVTPSTQICIDMQDCGFNSAIINVSTSVLKGTVDFCVKRGIYPVIHNERLMQTEADCKKFINDNKGLTGLGGWMLKDTVAAVDVKAGSALDNMIGWIREADPKHPVFTGIQPGSEFLSTGTNSYRQYIADFEYNLSPSFWPYRYFSRYTLSPSQHSPYSSFYNGLETFAFMTRYTNVPMWSYVNTLSGTGSSGDTTLATEAQIRFEVFSALAYGAQGIAYWRYLPESDATNGLVTFNGEKTDQWYHAQKVNQEVDSYTRVFAGCNLVACRHTGLRQPAGTCMLSESFGPLMSMESGSSGVLLSHVCNQGLNYLVIVNHSVTASQELTLNFSRYWSLYKVNGPTETSYLMPTLDLTAPFTLKATLPAGGYLVYRWE